MTREGEPSRDIVLGNSQLLSLFFIVAALMGVAFTIGYIIGRNTGRVSAASAASTASPAPHTSFSADNPPPSRVAQDSDRPSGNASSPKGASAKGGTQPALPYDDAAQSSAAPAPEKAGAASEKTSSLDGASPVDPKTGGSYLQVAALKRPDAEHVIKVLRGHGFPAVLGESPKEGLFRILVGPFHDMGSLSDTKQKLRAAGFESIIAR